MSHCGHMAGLVIDGGNLLPTRQLPERDFLPDDPPYADHPHLMGYPATLGTAAFSLSLISFSFIRSLGL